MKTFISFPFFFLIFFRIIKCIKIWNNQDPFYFNQACPSSPYVFPVGKHSEVRKCKHGLFLCNKKDTFVAKSLREYGEWSELELNIFLELTNSTDPIIDVGANIGAFTVPLAKHVKNGTVVAFEPQRYNFQIATTNVVLNELSNVLIYNMALGREKGNIDIPVINSSNSFNHRAFSISETSDIKTEKIQLETLNSISIVFSRCPALIRIDNEGMELECLEGGLELIKRCHPTLYVKNNCIKDSSALIQFMDGLGYHLYWDIQPYYNPSNYFQNKIDHFTVHGAMNVSINVLAIHPKIQEEKQIQLNEYTRIDVETAQYWSHQYKVNNPRLNLTHWVRQLGDENTCIR